MNKKIIIYISLMAFWWLSIMYASSSGAHHGYNFGVMDERNRLEEIGKKMRGMNLCKWCCVMGNHVHQERKENG